MILEIEKKSHFLNYDFGYIIKNILAQKLDQFTGGRSLDRKRNINCVPNPNKDRNRAKKYG